jgi:hypothetical protein
MPCHHWMYICPAEKAAAEAAWETAVRRNRRRVDIRLTVTELVLFGLLISVNGLELPVWVWAPASFVLLFFLMLIVLFWDFEIRSRR